MGGGEVVGEVRGSGWGGVRGAAKGMWTVTGRVREALREREEFDGLIYFCLMWQNPYFLDWDGKGESDKPIKTTLGRL